jgi:MoxR-like ATPase
VILADEINRATPKTQSALLEAMEEQQVTLDKTTHSLANPFFVIATQNPSQQIGTFPLPESQLDRFLMRLSIGYPNAESEHRLLEGLNPREQLKTLSTTIPPAELLEIQQKVAQVHTAKPLINYVQALLDFSRNSTLFYQGLSPRAGIGLVQSAKAWALINDRQDVYPEDIQAVFSSVVDHRLTLSSNVDSNSQASDILLKEVAIP